MKSLLPILFCVLLTMACSDDFTDIGSRPSAVSAEGEAYRVVRKARSYFKQNEKRLPFMQDRALRFTDFRYGLSRCLVWDANDLNNRISYIYEIKGRK